ncbi:Neutrophil collagenase, partial [Orchesella cincta]
MLLEGKTARNWNTNIVSKNFLQFTSVLHIILLILLIDNGSSFNKIYFTGALNGTVKADDGGQPTLSFCGLIDNLNNTHRMKRFAVYGSKWEHKRLSYRISKYPSSVEDLFVRERINENIAKAFSLWETVTDLSLSRKESGNVDIDISFEKGDHGDGYPFDGPGSILSHAFYPRVNGSSVHFDDDDEWNFGLNEENNFLKVAGHEFGHVLGLSHSAVEGSIMYPWYNSNFTLHEDDIQGIQQRALKELPASKMFITIQFHKWWTEFKIPQNCCKFTGTKKKVPLFIPILLVLVLWVDVGNAATISRTTDTEELVSNESKELFSAIISSLRKFLAAPGLLLFEFTVKLIMFFEKCTFLFLAFVTCLQSNYWNGAANAIPVPNSVGRSNLQNQVLNALSSRNFTSNDALTYLRKFGWLTPDQWRNGTQPVGNFKRLFREFQTFQGIPATGELDKNTIEVMEAPRCGVADRNVNGSINFELLGTKWEFRNLTYTISKYPKNPRLLGGRQNIDAEIRRAFEVWEQVVDFTFTKRDSGRTDINIRFESREHGQREEPFDGPGRVLAHAFRPPVGMVHFDEEERWTMGSAQGTNFFQVAAHEFGHALGLGHSDVRSALMFPSYRGYEANFQLDNDDIQGIQTLYGSSRRPTSPPRGGSTGRVPTRINPRDNQPQPPRITPTGNRPSRPTTMRPRVLTPRQNRTSGSAPTGGMRPPSMTPMGRNSPQLTPNRNPLPTIPTETRSRQRPANRGSSGS